MAKQRQIDQLNVVESLRLAILTIDAAIEENRPPAGRGGLTSMQRDLLSAKKNLLRLHQTAKTVQRSRRSLARKYFR